MGNFKKGFEKPFSFFASNYACTSKTAILENSFLIPLQLRHTTTDENTNINLNCFHWWK